MVFLASVCGNNYLSVIRFLGVILVDNCSLTHFDIDAEMNFIDSETLSCLLFHGATINALKKNGQIIPSQLDAHTPPTFQAPSISVNQNIQHLKSKCRSEECSSVLPSR